MALAPNRFGLYDRVGAGISLSDRRTLRIGGGVRELN